MKKKKLFVFLSIEVVIALFTMVLFLFNYNGLSLDRNISKYVSQNRIKGISTFFIYFTKLGNTFGVILIMLIFILFICYKKKYKEILFYIIGVLGAWLLNDLIKYIVRRPRPPYSRLVVEKSYSFPSAHAMVSISLAILTCYILGKMIKEQKNKRLIYFCFAIYVILIGASRVYLGVHYLSDVLYGYIFGSLFSVVYISVVKKIK